MADNYKHQTKYYAANREAIVAYRKKKRDEAKASGKYRCDPCDKSFVDKSKLSNHMNTKRHNPGRYIIYKCPSSLCKFKTKGKSHYNKHLLTKKHALNVAIPVDNVQLV